MKTGKVLLVGVLTAIGAGTAGYLWSESKKKVIAPVTPYDKTAPREGPRLYKVQALYNGKPLTYSAALFKGLNSVIRSSSSKITDVRYIGSGSNMVLFVDTKDGYPLVSKGELLPVNHRIYSFKVISSGPLA